MKRIIFFICLLVLIFYTAWPAYSLYEIATGIQKEDEATITRKVAWQPLRQSLKQPITERVQREIQTQSKGKGLEGALAGQLASEMTPKVVEKVLDAYVTPKGVITIAKQGGRIDVSKLGIGNLLTSFGGSGDEEGGGLFSGLLDKAKKMVGSSPEAKDLLSTTLGKFSKDLAINLGGPATDNEAKSMKTRYGLANIKYFKFIDPWSFEVGLAKSPDAKAADLIAGMSFINRDWKLSKIVPTL